MKTYPVQNPHISKRLSEKDKPKNEPKTQDARQNVREKPKMRDKTTRINKWTNEPENEHKLARQRRHKNMTDITALK